MKSMPQNPEFRINPENFYPWYCDIRSYPLSRPSQGVLYNYLKPCTVYCDTHFYPLSRPSQCMLYINLKPGTKCIVASIPSPSPHPSLGILYHLKPGTVYCDTH